MSHRVAHYAVYVNSIGPDYVYCASRRDLAAMVRYYLDARGMAATAIRQADIRKRWARIARNGSSVEHFVIENRDQRISFDGMTEGEYADATRDAA